MSPLRRALLFFLLLAVISLDYSEGLEDSSNGNSEAVGGTECMQIAPRTGTGRCASGYAKWLPPKDGYYVPYSNVEVVYNITIHECRQLCWANPRCESADFTTWDVNGLGSCFVNNNGADKAVYKSGDEHLLTFECCDNVVGKCMPIAPRTGPAHRCANGYAKWLPPKEGYYVPYSNVEVVYNITINTCRQLCWANPRCESADFTTWDATKQGSCFLNNNGVDKAVYKRADEHLLIFECCDNEVPVVGKCMQMAPRTGTGRCASGYAKFLPPKEGYYVPYSNVEVVYGISIHECRHLCWANHRCESADFTTWNVSGLGSCFLNNNGVDKAVYKRADEHLLTFECCDNDIPVVGECTQMAPRTGTGRCESGYAKFLPAKDGYFVPYSNVEVVYNITIHECRHLCWANPRCESADFTTWDVTKQGSCFLNNNGVDKAIYKRGDEHLLTFECCGRD